MRARLATLTDKAFPAAEAGGVTLFMLFVSLSITILAGLAIDVSNAFYFRNRMQMTADAAALAAAHQLPDEDAATETAHAYIDANMPAEVFGAAASFAQVSFGVWDGDSRTISATTGDADTVLVRLIRTEALGERIPTMMLFLIGFVGWETEVSAAASVTGGSHCVGGAAGELPDIAGLSPFTLLGNNLLLHNVAVHGDIGVSARGVITHTSASDIFGDVYYGLGVTEAAFSGTFTGTRYYGIDLEAAQAQVYSASSAMAAMPSDYSMPSVSVGTRFQAIGANGVTVVNIADVNLGGSNRIELVGGDEDYFVVNISDSSPRFGGSSGIVGVGVSPGHILINFTSGGNLGTVAQINAVLNGSIFVPNAAATFHSANGALYGGLGELKMMSDATLTGVPFVSPCETVNSSGSGGQMALMRG